MHSIQINQECCLFLFVEPQRAGAGEAAVREISSHICLYDSVCTCVWEPSGFHAAYLNLHRSVEQQRSARFELPVSVENRIVNLLRANHCEKCRQFLKTLRGVYTPDALMRLFYRIGAEMEYPLDTALDLYDNAVLNSDEEMQWAVLDECTANLCAYVNASHRKPASDPSAESICLFIRDHYNDPDLCIAQLSERFSIHRSLVSRLIKLHTGMTFSQYLQQLRIEAAMQLV